MIGENSKSNTVLESTACFGYVASDFVITPDWCAKDIIEHFKPTGKLLDPCEGKGAFLQYMQDASWCEIQKGIDFFDWTENVDWIISNPPYSIFKEWLIHSYEVAENIVYLLPSHKIFNPLGILRIIKREGWIKHIRLYDTKGNINWARGRPIIAIHLQKGYFGETTWSFYNEKAT